MAAETKSAGSQDATTIEQWDHDHVIHPQYAPATSDRPRVMVEGRGSRLVDSHGREYLDATGGLWLAQVGHGRRELAAAAQEQMEKLEYFASFWDFTNEPAARLARRLTDLSGLAGVYFTTGGSESNEIAIMMARLFHARHGSPGRTVILARRKAYHGVTYAARAATGLDVFHTDVGPLPGDFVHLTPPEPYRMDSCTDTCVAELEATIEELGADRIAAMIAEPVMGMAGMVAPPDDYWPRIAALLQEHGILLILDEVVTAYGRTGTWFAAEHWNLAPDIISTAKGLTSGYVPLGAVLVSHAVQDAVLEPPGFISGFTYNGHPTCCAVALANLEIIEAEGLLASARETGSYLLAQLTELLELDVVGDVRGFGMMLGVELVKDKAGKEPNLELAEQLNDRFTEETGVIVRSVANHLIFSPPLVFTRDECDQVAAATRAMITKYGD